MAVIIFASFAPQFARAQVIKGADFEQDISSINDLEGNKRALCEHKFADNIKACKKAHDDVISALRQVIEFEKKFALAYNAQDVPTARDVREKLMLAKKQALLELGYLENNFPAGTTPFAKKD